MIRRQFLTLLPRLRKIIPIMLEQSLFKIAISETAGTQTILEIFRHAGRCNSPQQSNRNALLSVGFWFLWRAAIPNDCHDFLPDGLFVAEDFIRIAVTLAHLLTVRSRHHSDLFANLRLGNDKGLSVSLI